MSELIVYGAVVVGLATYLVYLKLMDEVLPTLMEQRKRMYRSPVIRVRLK